MLKKQAGEQPSQQAILNRNKIINKKTVFAHNRLEQQLKKLGVEIKPDFSIEPPLGRDRTRFYSRNF